MSNALTIIEEVREELRPIEAQVAPVLPAHISSQKFMSVCMTALDNNPDLINADRQSLKVACLNAANDGLLPDKREGAFVIFNEKVKRKDPKTGRDVESWVKAVKWMPMIGGILKKAYQSGKVQSISVELVHKNDTYRRAAGDDAQIVHEPLDFGDRGPVIGGYCIIRLKDADPYREVMSLDQINKVRSVSKSKDNGPWVTWWEEQAKKTLLRRALKRTPLSAELDQVFQRDDYLYDMDAEHRPMIDAPAQTRALPKAAIFSDEDIAHEDTQTDDQHAPSKDTQTRNSDAGTGGKADRIGGGVSDDSRDAVVDESAQLVGRDDGIAGVGERAGTNTGGNRPDDKDSAGIDAETFDSLCRLIGTAETDEEMDDAWMTIESGPHYDNLSSGQETTLLNVADRQRIKVMKFRAFLSSQEPPREFDRGDEWADAILGKLKSLTDEKQAQAFWKRNIDYVRGGARKNPASAERIMKAVEVRFG